MAPPVVLTAADTAFEVKYAGLLRYGSALSEASSKFVHHPPPHYGPINGARDTVQGEAAATSRRHVGEAAQALADPQHGRRPLRGDGTPVLAARVGFQDRVIPNGQDRA